MSDSLRSLLHLAFDLGHIYSGIRVQKPGTDQVFTIRRRWSKTWMEPPTATYTDGKGNPITIKTVFDEGTPEALTERGVSYDEEGWLIPTDDMYAVTHSILQLFVHCMRTYGDENDPHRSMADAIVAWHAALGTLRYFEIKDAEDESDDVGEDSGGDVTEN